MCGFFWMMGEGKKRRADFRNETPQPIQLQQNFFCAKIFEYEFSEISRREFFLPPA